MSDDRPAKPVLLTGASGALGRVLARELGQAGWTLRLTDIAPFPDPLPPGAVFRRADLEDGVALLRQAEGCGAVLHFGGTSVEKPFEEVIGANIRGLHHVYEAARRERARSGPAHALDRCHGRLAHRQPSRMWTTAAL